MVYDLSNLCNELVTLVSNDYSLSEEEKNEILIDIDTTDESEVCRFIGNVIFAAIDRPFVSAKDSCMPNFRWLMLITSIASNFERIKYMSKYKKIIFIISIICILFTIGISIFSEKYVFFNGEIYSKEITELRIREYKNLRNIKTFPNLKKVVIGSSWDMSLGSLEFLEESEIEELVIIAQNIEDWSSLEKLTNLKTFIIYMSNFSDMSYISELKNLETIRIDGSQIVSLDHIENLSELKHLSLYCNRITDIDIEELSSLNKLEYLCIGKNYITSLQGFEKLKSLKSLSIEYNSISDFDVLCRMSNLEKIEVSENELPTEISETLAENGVEIIITPNSANRP